MNGIAVLESWQPVASASSPEGLQQVTPTVEYLEHGQEFRFVIDLEWWAPIAPFFDLFLAEDFVNTFLDVGGRIIDVWGEGLQRVVIWARADATAAQSAQVSLVALRPIILALAGAIIAAGIAIAIGLITLFVKVSGEAADIVVLVMTLMIFGLMFGVMGKFLPGEEKPQLTAGRAG